MVLVLTCGLYVSSLSMVGHVFEGADQGDPLILAGPAVVVRLRSCSDGVRIHDHFE